MTSKPIILPSIIVANNTIIGPNEYNIVLTENIQQITITLINYSQTLQGFSTTYFNLGTQTVIIINQETTQTWSLPPNTSLRLFNNGTTAEPYVPNSSYTSWETNGNLLTGPGVIGSINNQPIGFYQNSAPYMVLNNLLVTCYRTFDCTSNNIINLANPINLTDAATKNYVDNTVTNYLHLNGTTPM
jgi:hypothetical protein